MVSISTKEKRLAVVVVDVALAIAIATAISIYMAMLQNVSSLRKGDKRGKMHMLERKEFNGFNNIIYVKSNPITHSSILSSHISGYILKIFPFASAMESIKDSSSDQKAIIPYAQASMPRQPLSGPGMFYVLFL